MPSQISKVIASTWIAGEGGLSGINITSANIIICKVDLDPSINGLSLPQGTIALLDDGSASFLKTGGGANDWTQLLLKSPPKIRTVDSDYSINKDNDKIILIDTTNNSVEITLPAASTIDNDDGIFIIKRVSGTNDVTVTCNVADLIEGNSSINFQSIGVGNISLTLSSNLVDSWFII